MLDRVSMMSMIAAGAIVGADMMGYLPSMLTEQLSGDVAKIVLGVGVVVSAYYHLPTAIVLASVLYVSLNQQEEVAPIEESTVEEAVEETKQEDSMLMPLEDANETGVQGVVSMDMAEGEVLPTQDNSAPAETATEQVVQEVGEGVDPTMVNAEDLSQVLGISGNDMAPAL